MEFYIKKYKILAWGKVVFRCREDKIWSSQIKETQGEISLYLHSKTTCSQRSTQAISQKIHVSS